MAKVELGYHRGTGLPSIQLWRDSRLLVDRLFYEDTYLRDDDGQCVLWVRHIGVVETPTGRRKLRAVVGVGEYENDDELIRAIRRHRMRKVPDKHMEDRAWAPKDYHETAEAAR